MSEPAAPAVSTSAPPAGSPPAGEGCPTPLAWPDVLAAFRAQRDEFLLPTSWGDVSLWEFGAGPPLVLLDDAAGDPELLALMAWLLKDEFRCLLMQFPQPPSTVSAEHWLPGMADLLVETLRSRQVVCPPVFGTGCGGTLALQTALQHPARLGSLILQGCQPQRQWRRRERWLLSLGERLDGHLGQVPFWSRVVESNHRRWFPPFDGSRWEFLRDKLAGTPIRRYVRQLLAADRANLASRLSAVTQPVLVIRTEGEGRMATEAQEQMAAALPKARVEWMHTTGQFPYVTHPHRLVKLLRDFVAENPAAAQASAAEA
ncbi:MAG: alpha/beta fold hydrolase [Planctomycetaceae bacterium]